jgi:hypothetical protein
VLKKNIWANFQRIVEPFTQKIVTKLSKIRVWDPGSGENLFRIPDPGVKEAPDPGSGSATLIQIPTHSSIFWWQRRGDGSVSWQRPAVSAPCWGRLRGSRAAGVWSQLAAAVEQVPTAVPTVSLWTGRVQNSWIFFPRWRFRHVPLFVCVCLLVVERLDRSMECNASLPNVVI